MVQTLIDRLCLHCAAWWERWTTFWFRPEDAFGMGLLRILTGCMLLYSHTIWGLALPDFLGDVGWNNANLLRMLQDDGVSPSLFWMIPPNQLFLIHWMCQALIVLFILGLGGRFITVFTWIIAVSYANRSMLSNFGLDQLLCILLLYLMIARSTDALSLDVAIRRWRGKPEKEAASSTRVATRLMQLHFCVIYLWAGLGKLQGEAWWNGEAFWLAIANQEYQSMDLTWLARYPRFTELLTHATIAWELAFSALIWPKSTRPIMLAIGVLMHLGIGLFLGMWTFGSIMIFGYLVFVSPSALRSLSRRDWSRWMSGEVIAADEADSTETKGKNRIFAKTNAMKTNDVNISSKKTTIAKKRIATTTSDETMDGSPSCARPSQSRSRTFNPLFMQGHFPVKTFILIAQSRPALARLVNLLASDEREFVSVGSIEEARVLAPFLPNAVALLASLEEFKPNCDWLDLKVVDLNTGDTVESGEEPFLKAGEDEHSFAPIPR